MRVNRVLTVDILLIESGQERDERRIKDKKRGDFNIWKGKI